MTVAILGRNGAGKSTLMKSIIGLIAEKSGSIRFNGSEISTLPHFRVSRVGIGYAPEERRIFTELTVRENLAVGRKAAQGQPRWMPDRLIEVFPNLGNLLNRPGAQMSGGEQQMVTIAQVAARLPRLDPLFVQSDRPIAAPALKPPPTDPGKAALGNCKMQLIGRPRQTTR